MSDETANGNIENVDDLEAFEKDFFGTKTAEVEEDVADETEDEVPDDEDSVETDSTDDDQDQDQEEPSEEDEPEEPAKRNRKTAQERIKELTAEKYEAQRREVETLRRLRELEEKLATPKEDSPPAKAKAPSTEAPSPDAVDKDGESLYPLGEFDPAYIRDLTRFTINSETENARQAEATRREQEAIQSARAQAQEVWTGRLEEAKKDIPDVVEKITSLADTFNGLPADYGQYLVDVVQTLENGPSVLAYLADNPKEAQQIVSSGATTATISLGRLDARLAKATLKEKVVKVTAAPPAPQKTARGTGRVATSADTDDLAAFEKQFFSRKK